jgi:uncharacterized alkaline shock family protein YloU
MKEIKEAKSVVSEKADGAGTVLEVTGMGEVKIHENVISALVRKAVMSVDGVARLSGSQLVDIIAETVGSRRMQDRAITITVDDEGRSSIDIKLNLKFGYKIPEVSTAVQKTVISEVENITGMTVAKVNVIVQELETQEELDAADAAASASAADILLPPQH